MAELPRAQQITSFTVDRELLGYEIADIIAIPSMHVKDSFEPWPELAGKIHVSPYGVDLDQFPLRRKESTLTSSVLFVGSWSYRKGADILTEAILKMDDVELIHVGSLLDVPFPSHPRFIHHEPVAQSQLSSFCATAPVFVLASREDGFGLVLCQALASGMRVVSTDRTGGPDLANLPGLSRLIRIVPAGDAEALRQALIESLNLAGHEGESITDVERQLLGWSHYARQHLDLINELLKKPPSVSGDCH